MNGATKPFGVLPSSETVDRAIRRTAQLRRLTLGLKAAWTARSKSKSEEDRTGEKKGGKK